MKKRIITRPIWILSLVSLFTDISSEMLYPVMPLFLKSIGFSVVLIGILEGIAEATAGLSKGYFGQLSDKHGKRVPFIRGGYFLSAISKPMMALFTYPIWIFFARTADRLGKGIRTSARDAYLSDQTIPEYKARVFGFHRAFDTLGAFLGPVIALIFLQFYPEQYRLLFVIAFLPGIISISLTFMIKEIKKEETATKKEKVSFLSFLKYLSHSPKTYKLLFFGLIMFSLFNSSDVFLLLMMKEKGVNDYYLILAYVFYNLVYAVFAYPVGILADKLGLKKILIFGFLLFSIVYFGFGYFSTVEIFIALLLIYGVFAACNESIGKAWITNIVEKNNTATAIGTYTAFNSVITMLASSITGIFWYYFGPSVALYISAIGSIVVLIYFIILVPEKQNALHGN